RSASPRAGTGRPRGALRLSHASPSRAAPRTSERATRVGTLPQRWSGGLAWFLGRRPSPPTGPAQGASMPTVTLADVAAAARVSRSTASRVVRGTGPVSAEARRAVLAAVEHLGYVPHPGARALASGHGERVVVAVGSPSADLLADPYVARV